MTTIINCQECGYEFRLGPGTYWGKAGLPAQCPGCWRALISRGTLENTRDFSDSGLGIGGINNAIPTAAEELRQTEAVGRAEERREQAIASGQMKKAACGHYTDHAMTTSRGSSCPDCYDRMSDY